MGADFYREEDPQGLSLPLSIIQTFRVDQKRTANISNSPTSTNDLGPLARYRIIYRFRRRTNYHDSTILSVNYLFLLQLVGAGLNHVVVLNLNDVLHRFVRRILRFGFPQILFTSIRSEFKNLRWCFLPRAMLLTLALT